MILVWWVWCSAGLAWAQPMSRDDALDHADRWLYQTDVHLATAPALREPLAAAIWAIDRHEWDSADWQLVLERGGAWVRGELPSAMELHDRASESTDRTSVEWLKQRVALATVTEFMADDELLSAMNEAVPDDAAVDRLIYAGHLEEACMCGLNLDRRLAAVMEAGAVRLRTGAAPTSAELADLVAVTSTAAGYARNGSTRYFPFCVPLFHDAAWRLGLREGGPRSGVLDEAGRRDLLAMVEATRWIQHPDSAELVVAMRHRVTSLFVERWDPPAGASPADVWLLLRRAEADAAMRPRSGGAGRYWRAAMEVAEDDAMRERIERARDQARTRAARLASEEEAGE